MATVRPVSYTHLKNGDVAIASITSCTNTSNPSVMIAAGLIARNAHAKGLKPKPWVKTSLAPGSQVVADYLKAAGLQDDLDACLLYTSSGARSVVYIACDPASLARDTATLASLGYDLADIRAFDIYPTTHHVETVALFRKATR